MSEPEKKSSPTATGGPSVVVVDQTSGNRQQQSYRPTELQEETSELHHKRSRAPAVPSVAEEFKEICEDANLNTNADVKESKELDSAISYDKQKQSLAKKLSSSHKKTSEHANYETITLAPLKVETKLESVIPAQPVSPLDLTKESVISRREKEKSAVRKVEEDSIKDEISELRTPEADKKHSDWSDEEEAGGLPRSETRTSRVSRKVRTLFCCGVPYEAASEDDYITKCLAYTLEKKASVGPCRPSIHNEHPSGITISLPKKSSRVINVQSGISFNIPKKQRSKPAVNADTQEHCNVPKCDDTESNIGCGSKCGHAGTSKRCTM